MGIHRWGRLAGWAVIAAIWSFTLGLLGFFGAVYTIYADLRAPNTSHLTAGSYRELVAAILHGRIFAPRWPGANGAEFDPELLYVPKPGVSRFRGREFDAVVSITPDGLRDLPPRAPEQLRPGLVVLAGDSFTYGFGVHDHETFGSVLQEQYHYRTVNSGVPSYSTVRELLWLRRLGLLAKASVVIIQYCGNDAPENSAYVRRGDNALPIDDPRRFWERLIAAEPTEVNYGRVLSGVVNYACEQVGAVGIRGFAKAIARDRHPTRRQYRNSVPDMAGDFLSILDRFPELAGKPVIVTEMNPYGEYAGIVPLLAGRCADRPNLKVVPLQFDAADYFRFDAHLNARGHQRAADQLAAALRALGQPGSEPTR